MIKLEFTKPTVPNFINFHRNNTPVTVPIQDLTVEELMSFIELYRKTIIDHWERKQGEVTAYRGKTETNETL
jgi:hypothetical protein